MAEFWRKYATATHVYIPMIKRAVVDFAVGADWTPVAGDVKISIDGGAVANVATLPVAIASGNGAFWDFALSSGETTGKKISVITVDAATKAVEDQMFDILTYGNASAELVPDYSAALATPTNITAGTITTVTTLTNLPSIPANWLTAAGIAAAALNGKGDWNTTTPPTTAAIATGVWTDTTAGDFTAANSVGKSVMNGVALGTGLTVNSLTNLPSIPANWLTAAGINAAALNGKGDWMVSYTQPTGFLAATFPSGTVANTTNITSITGNITGNLSGSVGSVTARVTANTDQINGNATAASNLEENVENCPRGTCSGGTNTTAVVSSMTTPASLTAAGQLVGRTIVFDWDTTTAALQGQASNITNSTTGATPTITFGALTAGTVPANGDTFSIV